MSVSIHVSEETAVRLITLDGNLDEQLTSQLEEVLSESGETAEQKIIIDLEKVPVIAPEGVRVLLNAFYMQKQAGLSLINPNSEVKKLLITVGLERLIKS